MAKRIEPARPLPEDGQEGIPGDVVTEGWGQILNLELLKSRMPSLGHLKETQKAGVTEGWGQILNLELLKSRMPSLGHLKETELFKIQDLITIQKDTSENSR
ncbi:hypothetical protein [Desulfomicrobium baculatum]|uniref:hypothetical protein n=1 Tax=Desulfomicrobium baculatum TaxID=899 RepID=UPI0005C1C2B9|nr:hypothetical protein [Desulfomicrobium baculatum]